jgi:hypothetical protein
MKIEKRTIKMAVTREGEPCATWPHCHCIVQGYYNLAEKNCCGRKPKTRRIVNEETVDA